MLQFYSRQCIFTFSSLAAVVSPFFSWCKKMTNKGQKIEEKGGSPVWCATQFDRRDLASLLKAQTILGASKFTPILAFGNPASLRPLVIQRQ